MLLLLTCIIGAEHYLLLTNVLSCWIQAPALTKLDPFADNFYWIELNEPTYSETAQIVDSLDRNQVVESDNWVAVCVVFTAGVAPLD